MTSIESPAVFVQLHFRRSDGEGNQGFEEHVKFAIVWGARQSGEKLSLQHFAGNRATAVVLPQLDIEHD